VPHPTSLPASKGPLNFLSVVGLRLRGKQRLNAPSVMGPEASEFGFVGSRACDYPTGDRFSRDSLLESAARW